MNFYNHANKSISKSALISGTFKRAFILAVLVKGGIRFTGFKRTFKSTTKKLTFE